MARGWLDFVPLALLLPAFSPEVGVTALEAAGTLLAGGSVGEAFPSTGGSPGRFFGVLWLLAAPARLSGVFMGVRFSDWLPFASCSSRTSATAFAAMSSKVAMRFLFVALPGWEVMFLDEARVIRRISAPPLSNTETDPVARTNSSSSLSSPPKAASVPP